MMDEQKPEPDSREWWKAMYEAREQEAHELSERIIKLSASAAEIERLRAALTNTADMLGSACHFVSKANGLERMLAVVDEARAALSEKQP